MQRFAMLHLDGGALLVGQIRADGAHERRGRLVAAGLAVLPGMVDLIEQFLFLGLQLVQLDGELAVLGQVDGRRMVERGERAVERLDVALGQPHHLPDVLQLVAQRRDLLEIERHDVADAVGRPRPVRRARRGVRATAAVPSPRSDVPRSADA